MSDRTAEVALHGEREDILRSAVAAAREVVGADVAFAAIQNDRGTYDMSIRDNCTLDPPLREIAGQDPPGAADDHD